MRSESVRHEPSLDYEKIESSCLVCENTFVSFVVWKQKQLGMKKCFVILFDFDSIWIDGHV